MEKEGKSSGKGDASEKLLPSTAITVQPIPSAPPFEGPSEVISESSGTRGNVLEAADWVPVLEPIPNCPPGLEQLYHHKEFVICKEMGVPVPSASWKGCKAVYSVRTPQGQRVFYVFEESEAVCCNLQPDFVLHVTNCINQEILEMRSANTCCDRGISCLQCCCGVMHQETAVFLTSGRRIGDIKRRHERGLYTEDRKL